MKRKLKNPEPVVQVRVPIGVTVSVVFCQPGDPNTWDLDKTVEACVSRGRYENQVFVRGRARRLKKSTAG